MRPILLLLLGLAISEATGDGPRNHEDQHLHQLKTSDPQERPVGPVEPVGLIGASDHLEPAANVQDTAVAFSASLSANREISPGSPIVCDQSPINEGGRYFNTSGQFACVDEAVYVFYWTARRVGGVHCLSTLKLGAVPVTDGPLTSYYSEEFNSGTAEMITVLQCTTNPLSSVTVTASFDNTPSATYGADLTTFSGFRLEEADFAIGFTAEMSKDTKAYPGGRLVFDKVTSNLGGFYERLHGYFRCPDDGVYVFAVSIHCPEPLASLLQWSVGRLVFNGDAYMLGPMTYSASDVHPSGSATLSTVLECQTGKDVYVESHDAFEFESNLYGAGLTSFSGFGLCHENCSDYVAFTAVLTSNASTNSIDVIFDDVFVNVGSAYDHSTGQFECPDGQLYMFSWSATSTGGSCNLDLYMGETLVKSSHMMYQPGSSDIFGTSGTASMSTIVRCTTGSVISLRGQNLNANRMLLADYTVFSGYRIPGQ